MATATGLTVIKRMTYRGDSTEEYSNTYWFTGTPPADATAWRALFNAVVNLEKYCYPNTVSVIRGYGYNDDTGHKPGDLPPSSPAVYNVDLTVSPETPVPGTLTITGGTVLPGDSSVWARWKTSRLTSPGGKAIYIRKYFHPAVCTTGTPDVILPAQKSSLTDLGLKLSDGTLVGSRKITTCGQADVITAYGASSYTTVRTLKRRGKRT